MILPGVASILLPVIVGKFFGVKALGGLLAGATVTGVSPVFMNWMRKRRVAT